MVPVLFFVPSEPAPHMSPEPTEKCGERAPFEQNWVLSHRIQLEHPRISGIGVLGADDDGVVCLTTWQSSQTFVNNKLDGGF